VADLDRDEAKAELEDALDSARQVIAERWSDVPARVASLTGQPLGGAA
jgi:hypothetical protein